jgi:hypothetical protein
MSEPAFLDLEEVLEIHALQLADFGGLDGVRGQGLLSPRSNSRERQHLANFSTAT